MDPSHLPISNPPTNFQDLAWVILMLPLVSALVITLGLRRSRVLTTTLSLAAVATGFGLSVWLFFLFGVRGLPVIYDAMYYLKEPADRVEQSERT